VASLTPATTQGASDFFYGPRQAEAVAGFCLAAGDPVWRPL
jgi:hypothetical protein